jgi:CheY-like chemotaxis protein
MSAQNPRPALRGSPQDFHDLMRFRVMDVLLVASPYDSFLLGEAGELAEQVLGEFRNLDLHYGPGLTSVSTGAEALALLEERRFGLIITTLHLLDMNAAELVRRLRERDAATPVVFLAFDSRELREFVARHGLSGAERAFLWQGDARILLAVVKSIEDARNVAHDTRAMGVQVILLIEDNVRYYSSFLPTIYAELLHHSQRLLTEGANVSEKILRMRARPKILLCGCFEEAWQAFETYREDILGVVSDVEFPEAGRHSDEAGLRFARAVREIQPDVPILLQSSRPENEKAAQEAGFDFLLKGSPLLLQGLRRFMTENFGFGEFVFRLPDGREVSRARDLRGLEDLLRSVPAESIGFHAARNHFSKWLKARTEFALAQRLRPRKIADFPSLEALRDSLADSVAEYRRERTRAVVADFERESFDFSAEFYRIGGGSLGGKARGLVFLRRLLAERGVEEGLAGVRVSVPQTAVIATDGFDRFLDAGGLRDFAIRCADDAEIERRFLEAEMPAELLADLRAFVERVGFPLAVRSSSLLEDSQHQPFTGVYETFVLANNHPSIEVRLEQLVRAVKRVYASTFCRHAKDYIRPSPFRLEEEKMAVILQRLVGAERGGNRFYPDLAGVARSCNYYPTPPVSASDGIAAVALGLGRSVVEGGACLRFCPRHPGAPLAFSSPRELVDNTQRRFWALELDGAAAHMRETEFDLAAAEADGTLARLASTYAPDDDTLHDGVTRPGVRVVSFAPILKGHAFPLAEILSRLLPVGEWGMGSPVEVEFAATLPRRPGEVAEFGVLQLRPLAPAREAEELRVDEAPQERLLCRSRQVMGHGRIEDIRDLVVVDRLRFDRSASRQTAQELAEFNARLLDEARGYLLVGVGRWGSRDPWLGIPVTWDQISGARVIVETGFKDFRVTPSQGSHFFQNLSTFNIGYFTLNPDAGDGSLDWEWLSAQPALKETACVRHLRLEQPLTVVMNGTRTEGVILKPARESGVGP